MATPASMATPRTMALFELHRALLSWEDKTTSLSKTKKQDANFTNSLQHCLFDGSVWNTYPKTSVPYMFYTKFHSPRPIFYWPSSKCTRIDKRASISCPQCGCLLIYVFNNMIYASLWLFMIESPDHLQTPWWHRSVHVYQGCPNIMLQILETFPSKSHVSTMASWSYIHKHKPIIMHKVFILLCFDVVWHWQVSPISFEATSLALQPQHDDVIKWKHFLCYWPFVCTSHRWIPCTKASDADLWCFHWSAPE